jgi:hypothetical protein
VWSLADAAYWTKQGLWPTAGNTLKIEDVFSPWLYTGTGAAQTITNGINLSGQGGMVWIKSRSAATNNFLFDTTRGVNVEINSNTTDANATLANSLTAFNSNGFSISSAAGIGVNAATYASWTFCEAINFFDVVTYTGDGANRNISHNLGAVPGMIIVKRTDASADWQVYHRSNANTQYMVLNSTAAVATGATRWNSTTPTATEFTVGTDTTVNASGGTYVAYLFAHDTASTGIIQCGSFTTDGSGNATVNLGWEPQWILQKRTSSTGDWWLADTMRGMSNTNTNLLVPNTSNAETSVSGGYFIPTATGFVSPAWYGASQTVVYVAIRRGPMKTPTLGTSVFAPTLATFSGTTVTNTGFVVDMAINKNGVATTGNNFVLDRLRGSDNGSAQQTISTNTTSAEVASSGRTALTASNVSIQTGFLQQQTTANNIVWAFGRAPGFFDEVCYTGTGVLGRTVAHNLGVVPEMMIFKRRSASNNWGVYHSALGNTKLIYLDLTLAPSTAINWWNNTTPTASVFTVGDQNENNSNGSTYVGYLFASVPGVSKVGSYTGTGALQTINCAFTTGARFVLIKRTDSTGDWFVWDSANGISSGNDPYLLLNSTAAQVTGTNYVDTTAVGFQVTAAAPAGINANGGSYIFLAIA